MYATVHATHMQPTPKLVKINATKKFKKLFKFAFHIAQFP